MLSNFENQDNRQLVSSEKQSYNTPLQETSFTNLSCSVKIIVILINHCTIHFKKNPAIKTGFFFRISEYSYIVKAIIAFCTCNLFSASSKITEFGESATSFTTSSPLCAGRQCMNK